MMKKCSQARFGHVTFVTSNNLIATCGGWTGASDVESSQCLVLNPGEGGEWQQDVMGDMVMGNQSAATCPTLDGGICNFPFKSGKYPAVFLSAPSPYISRWRGIHHLFQ